MEFFTWCWIWDKRLLCGLQHGKAFFIYLWLIPTIISIGFLINALYVKLGPDNIGPSADCLKVQEIKEYGDILRSSIYVEEILLCLSILTSLGMIIRTRYVFNKLVLKQKDAMTIVAPEFDYNWNVRISSLQSWIGYLTLTVGAANFLCSGSYVYLYFLYSDTVKSYGFE